MEHRRKSQHGTPTRVKRAVTLAILIRQMILVRRRLALVRCPTMMTTMTMAGCKVIGWTQMGDILKRKRGSQI